MSICRWPAAVVPIVVGFSVVVGVVSVAMAVSVIVVVASSLVFLIMNSNACGESGLVDAVVLRIDTTGVFR